MYKLKVTSYLDLKLTRLMYYVVIISKLHLTPTMVSIIFAKDS